MQAARQGAESKQEACHLQLHSRGTECYRDTVMLFEVGVSDGDSSPSNKQER